MRRCCLMLLLVCTPALAETPALLRPLPADQWDAQKAAHLLRRAGFGGTPEEVARLTQMSFAQAIAHVVDYEKLPQGPALKLEPADYNRNPEVDRMVLRALPPLLAQYKRQLMQRYKIDIDKELANNPDKKLKTPENLPTDRPELRKLKNATPRQVLAYLQRQAENRAVNQVVQKLLKRYQFQLRSWWLARMGQTRRPLEEKMTLFWHGHFATSYDTVRNPYHLKLQNDLFRRQATGNFKALVLGICRDPAMLRYLDGNRNTKRQPNENFARELMELFTLGIGHYSEQDVKEAARAFTGWTSVAHIFHFNRQQHDYGRKTFLGQTGHFNGAHIVEMIFDKPQTARFISRKLCRYFVTEKPDQRLVDGLATTLRKHDYQFKPMLRQLFSSRWFYSEPVVGTLIQSPAQLAVSTIRQLGMPLEGLAIAGNLLPKMGQDLFRPPNVKCWEGGRTWINASTMMARYNFLADLVKGGQELNKKPNAMQLRKSYLPQSLQGKASSWDTQALLALPLLKRLESQRTAAGTLDYLAGLLLARPLTPARRAKLLGVLRQGAFDPKRKQTKALILRVILLITSTPEYQLS